MLQSCRRFTGTQYAGTVALILTGMIASPAALFLSRPFGAVGLLVALAFTLLCLGLAWDQWRRKSELTILSISVPARAARTRDAV